MIAYVQSNTAVSTGTLALSAAFSSIQKVGNLNVVAVGWGDNVSTVKSVTDSLGNVYSKAINPTTVTGTPNQTQVIYYARNIKAGNNTVTVTFNSKVPYPDIRIFEYAGLDTVSPLGATASRTGSGTAATAGPIITGLANELIFCSGTTVSHFTASGPGFTKRLINQYGNIGEDQIAVNAGTYTATAPNSSGAWIMQAVSFRTVGIVPTPIFTPPAGTYATAQSVRIS